MFTGIITDIGQVTRVEQRGDTRLTIQTGFDTGTIAIGASIACNGVCLTAIELQPGAFVVEASAETRSRTTLGQWQTGTPLNLERSLKLGDELGGHLVYGHVDGLAQIVAVVPEGDSFRWTFRAPPDLSRFIAAKGSVALNGVSLTVNSVDGDHFGVNIIPHTTLHTTFGRLQAGDSVNLEVDMLARYVARLLATESIPSLQEKA
jgi:riboflavin synthase